MEIRGHTYVHTSTYTNNTRTHTHARARTHTHTNSASYIYGISYQPVQFFIRLSLFYFILILPASFTSISVKFTLYVVHLYRFVFRLLFFCFSLPFTSDWKSEAFSRWLRVNIWTASALHGSSSFSSSSFSCFAIHCPGHHSWCSTSVSF
jgi:hypothetical protein